MKKLILIISVFQFGLSYAQDIQARGREHLNKLAADDMYGRGYVRNGYERAVEYVEQQFAADGLQKINGTYRQDFVYPVNTFPDSVTVIVGSKKLVPGENFIVSPESGSDNGMYETVYYTLPKLFMKNMPVFRSNQVVVVQPYSRKMSKDSLRFIQQRLADFNASVPVILLSTGKLTWSVADEALDHARIEISETAFDTTAKKITINIHHELNPSFTSHNVIGIVPAKNKKQKKYLVVTAHLDHLGMMGDKAIFNGANDNASGISMLLTLAEHYGKTRPKYNMLFIAFGGEEAGLIGSKFFVDNPLVDLKQIKFLLNIDLMGTGGDGITVVNATKFTKPFEELKAINTKGNYLSNIKARGEAANSDHYWFTKAGVPSFFIYTMGGTTAYHDINDRPEQLPLTEFNDLNRLIVLFFNNIH